MSNYVDDNDALQSLWSFNFVKGEREEKESDTSLVQREKRKSQTQKSLYSSAKTEREKREEKENGGGCSTLKTFA